MPDAAVFTITYWGTTGTLSAPLSPAAVKDKVVAAVEEAFKRDNPTSPPRPEGIRGLVEAQRFERISTYGGHTTCVEVQTPDALIVLDCGTGFRGLGVSLSKKWNAPDYSGARDAHLLITHPHLDHIEALPYVGLLYDAQNHFSLRAGRFTLDTLSAFLDPQSPLSGKLFPPTYALLRGLQEFREIAAGAEFTIGTTQIQTFALNHPGGCFAYRLENAGRVFVFATDHEHPEVPDRRLADFARGADVIYMDGQYLAAEYEGHDAVPGDRAASRRGWGHSSVEACVATANEADVKQLHIGHREPFRTDEQTALVERYAQGLMHEKRGQTRSACRVLIPHEGLTFKL